MKILETNPPNIAEIIKAFPEVKGDKLVIFTYGDTVYAPGGKIGITPDIEVHEAVHIKQQKELGFMGPRRWWKKYLVDPEFRLEQELEAYRAQYKFITKTVKDRNEKLRCFNRFVAYLSGPTYGNLIPPSTAAELLRDPWK